MVIVDTQNDDRRPIPDPTVLTTAASARLEAMLRTLIKTEIQHQHDLFSEKFAGIVMQLSMLDARTAEQKSDTNNALNAALAAQKEQAVLQNTASEKSITKSETATTERIKGVETLLSTSTKATDDKITDLKDRVIAIEAVKLGNVEGVATVRASSTSTQAIIASIGGVILVIIAAASIIIAIFKP